MKSYRSCGPARDKPSEVHLDRGALEAQHLERHGEEARLRLLACNAAELCIDMRVGGETQGADEKGARLWNCEPFEDRRKGVFASLKEDQGRNEATMGIIVVEGGGEEDLGDVRVSDSKHP